MNAATNIPQSTTAHPLPWSTWPRPLWHALLLLWVLFWLLMLFVQTLDALDASAIRWWQPLVWEGSSALVVTLFGIAMLHYGSRQLYLLTTPWLWFWQHLKWLPLVSALFVVTAFGIRHAIYALAGLHYEHPPWLQVYLYETAKLALFLGLWLGVLFGFHSFIAWREQLLRLHAMQQALTESRLHQLKAQLQPHFLFNTLNTISGFMQTDVERADSLLTQLADLLRASLTLGDQHHIALASELALLRLYSNIMTERFGPHVKIEWHIDEASLDCPVPALLLQPLLENAFKHGVERSTTPVSIRVSIACDAEQLLISISNDLPATGEVKRSEFTGTGFGLNNCRERLQVIYGERATLISQTHADCFEVKVKLPKSIA